MILPEEMVIIACIIDKLRPQIYIIVKFQIYFIINFHIIFICEILLKVFIIPFLGIFLMFLCIFIIFYSSYIISMR